MRVLLVDDEAAVATALGDALVRRGVAIDHARTLDAAQAYLEASDYAAVLLDLGLPDGDGMELLTQMRARGDTRPVLVLSARGAIDARIRALNVGADEYMVKPFDLDEFYARLLAILRRRDGYVGRSLECGALRYSVETRVASVGERVLNLSARETELLELLLRRVGKVVPKRSAEDHLFGLGGDLGSNAIEVYVHRLRKRLDEAATGARIETVRGVGYMLMATPPR